MVGEHILGDIGYMLKTTTSSQENYNYAHKKTRVLMEQTSEDGNADFIAFMVKFEWPLTVFLLMICLEGPGNN